MSRPGKRVETRHPVMSVIAERWSPRSFAERPVEEEKLRSMFEAARLAPSAHNNQPTRFLVGRKHHDEGWKRLYDCLQPHNRAWAHTAPVLVLACAARRRLSQPKADFVAYPHFMHDLGLAVMSAILQAHADGLHCHPLAAFEPEQAREAFGIPELFEPGMIIAVGHLGPASALQGDLRAREEARRTRRDLVDIVFEERWGRASSLFYG